MAELGYTGLWPVPYRRSLVGVRPATCRFQKLSALATAPASRVQSAIEPRSFSDRVREGRFCLVVLFACHQLPAAVHRSG